MVDEVIQKIFDLVKEVAFDARDILANSKDVILKTKNVHGDTQTRFDQEIDALIINKFRDSRLVKTIHTEESAPVVLTQSFSDLDIYIDPVDGSKNSSINGNMGSLFGIYKGDKIIAAAYALYGINTIVITAYAEVSEYILTPEGSFEFVGTIKQLPKSNYLYIGGSYDRYTKEISGVVDKILKTHPKLMYDQAFVVNLHNLIKQGGVYFYPATEKYPNGKLRLMFEGKTAAFIIEKLGGEATDFTTRIIELGGDEQSRSRLLLGDREKVKEIISML